MAENSNIEWTDHTFNPFIGCTKVSPGCDHCYAEHLMDTRMHKVVWGPHGERVRTSASTWRQPIRWNARHAEFSAAHGRRQRVFCASLADVFDNAVDPAWRRDLFALIAQTPNLDWLLLTKRIGNVPTMLRHIGVDRIPDNVWLGATIVNQAEADRDIPKLLAVPARVHFLSMEPLLGPVELRLPTRIWTNSAGGRSCDHCCNGDRCDDPTHCERGRPDWHVRCPYCRGTGRGKPIDWVIVGGESSPGARPMHPDWARSLRDQCAASGVPFLFKQWGEWKPVSQMDETRSLYRSNRIAREGEDQGVIDDLYGSACKVDQLCLRIDGNHVPIDSPNAFLAGTSPMHAFKVGKRAAGRLLDGRTHDEFPEAR
ncbi:hypothetical protein WM29_22725 [Burkholderia ubonensis]|uniref:phage Gp37/Gp68 family protein n=1 Tax=Burkholderia ubonensis TaxID=101571 RepID=UPI00084185C6|nr:phage Gp37/Gp68 family protein [Burkholderia ubonensis]AOK61950.1 hypothetical protein WM29_22725 [Burkholderia ubonensis]